MACFLFHCKIRLETYLSNMIRGQMNSDQYRKKGCSIQGTTNCGASSEPDFIQNYFLWRRMFNFFDTRDKRRKLGFLRQTLFLALFDLFELCLVHFKPYIASFNLIWKKKHHSSPGRWNFSSFSSLRLDFLIVEISESNDLCYPAPLEMNQQGSSKQFVPFKKCKANNFRETCLLYLW